MAETPQRIPAVLSGHALRSLRDSGYSLAAALGEVVDNSLEANANNIALRLDESTSRSGKKHIHRIVVVDDGDGMEAGVLQHYLQLGFSTRYMRTDSIGKYGVGAKLGALNYAQRIDVWSRTNDRIDWLHTFFDLKIAEQQEQEGQMVCIEPPDTVPLPEDVRPLLPKRTGTVVMWSEVDRLEEGRRAADANKLRIEIEKELSRMFRYFLHNGIKISVNNTVLLPHDPLFLLEGTWADKALTEYYARKDKAAGGRSAGDRTGEKDHFPAQVITREPIEFGNGKAIFTMTLYPREVTRQRGMGGDDLAKTLRIPENEGAISFVRQQREINYTSLPFMVPGSNGDDPRIRFIGFEVAFTPELDDFFGVRNVKRGVEPHDELRAAIRKLIRKYISGAHERLDERWGKAARDEQEHRGEFTLILEAIKDANRTLPKSRAKGPEDKQEQERIFDDLANDVVGSDQQEKKREYREQIKDLPFVVEQMDFPGHQFLDTQHVDGKVIIRINTRHRFYRELWEPIKFIASQTPATVSGSEAVRTARRTIEALTLLVVAYGKAESLNENPHEAYSELRMYWGHFLDSFMGKVKDV